MTFSLELNEEQRQMQEWVHGFAESVVRPAAHEWDEREETPWPIIQQAAEVGIYSGQFLAHVTSDPTGLMLPVAIEELFWGGAGIGMAIMGTSLAVAALFGNGTPDQIAEWAPQCFGTPEQVQLGAFCVSEPDAGSDVSALKTRAVYDAAKDEGVLNGPKAWIRNGGHAAGAAGRARHVRVDEAVGGRDGGRHRARGLRVCAGVREAAQAVRPRDHPQPGDRVHARRHEDGDRLRAAAGLARVVDGAQPQAVRRGRGLDVQAEGGRGGRLGHRARDADHGEI